MTIKTCFSLVEEAKQRIKSINFKNALKLHSDGETIFIDLRDIRELEKNGKIKNAKHVPRGMLEFWIDPQSPYYRNFFDTKNKFIFYCASGWRSALSTKIAFEMGLNNVLNLEKGIDDWIKQNGPLEKLVQKKN
tara:strand:+ start:137 stop:538 length:402 start_codon:yes stop_codon:yes gene_type:complete